MQCDQSMRINRSTCDGVSTIDVIILQYITTVECGAFQFQGFKYKDVVLVWLQNNTNFCHCFPATILQKVHGCPVSTTATSIPSTTIIPITKISVTLKAPAKNSTAKPPAPKNLTEVSIGTKNVTAANPLPKPGTKNTTTPNAGVKSGSKADATNTGSANTGAKTISAAEKILLGNSTATGNLTETF